MTVRQAAIRVDKSPDRVTARTTAGMRIAPLQAGGSPASSVADAALLIRRLPWDHRVALVLCDGGHMRPEEAAAALGERPEVVRRRLGEAHQGLCALLASVDHATAAAGRAPTPAP